MTQRESKHSPLWGYNPVYDGRSDFTQPRPYPQNLGGPLKGSGAREQLDQPENRPPPPAPARGGAAERRQQREQSQ